MRVSRSFRRLAAGALVVAVTAGGAVLLGGAANAAPAPGENGTLTFTPATGSDNTIPDAHTSGPCPEGANVAQMEVTGPVGAQTPTFPSENPFLLTLPNATTFSTAGPFDVPGGLSLKAAAEERGTQLAAGEFDFTVTCVEEQLGDRFGTFTGAIYFTTPTAWQITDPSGPTPTPAPGTPTPTPGTPTPTPAPGTPTPAPGTPTPTPAPGTPTPTPAPGTPTPTPAPGTPTPAPGTPTPAPGTPTPGLDGLLDEIIAKVAVALQSILQFLQFLFQFVLGALQFNFDPR